MKFKPFLAILVSMMLAGCGEETSVAPTPTEEPSKEVSVAPTTTEEPITIPGLNLEMMPIPAGTFLMGSPNDEEGRDNDEGLHTVTITKPFWLGKTEVTQALWKAVMGNNPSRFMGDDLPVEKVSWTDAVAFCEKLNEMKRDTLPAGYHYTLPMEAQWEYACRAGTITQFSYGNDTGYSQLGSYVWCGDNSSSGTHPVGEKLPNDWGLYDMHGNVWEWCLDWYGEYPGGSITDPQDPQSGTYRVLRGGGWGSHARFCRSALRNGYGPGDTSRDLGFRVALTTVPSE
ncbi:formylglycine-generating enzyme family protein [bacterium]|nr:formylglycine-generating enzyme family protein [bacterium]